MTRLLTIIFCALPLLLNAETPHQHSYQGSHGMVLFAAKDSLLVSHLPLYRPPHDYQLIYEIKLPEAEAKQVLAKLKQIKQLTLLPEDFDLRKMINATGFTVTSDIYQGHFERGGERWLTGVKTTFKRQLYKRQLPAADTSADNGYYSAFKHQGLNFMLHQIGSAPSYDHILQVSDLPKSMQFRQNAADKLPELLIHQGIEVKQLYLETQDFLR